MTSDTRTIHAPRGAERTAKSWGAEAAKRMLMNNLDPEVAEPVTDILPETVLVDGEGLGEGRERGRPDAFHMGAGIGLGVLLGVFHQAGSRIPERLGQSGHREARQVRALIRNALARHPLPGSPACMPGDEG